MRKILIAVLIIAFSATTVHASLYTQIAGALENMQFFPDVALDHPNHIAISWMADEGAINGYPDGTFKPNGLVNRAELMKMVLPEVPEGDYQNCFPDVTTEWFAPYVCYGLERGFVNGYPDGTFKPANDVNRVEAMKIILNVHLPENRWPTPTQAEQELMYPADILEGEWYEGYAKFSIAKELVDGQHVTQNPNGSLNYYPAGPMSRKEVSEMVFRLIIYEAERIVVTGIIAEAACYSIENPGLSAEDVEAYAYGLFAENGYTAEEADAVSEVLQLDDVVDADIDVQMVEICSLQ
ncbi:S-layer homology domain-containing protein [Patescibacteria group bacterium]